MTSKVRQRAPIAWLLLCAALGCHFQQPPANPDLAPVRGSVTVNGQPHAGLQVYFHSASSRPSVAMTDENGGYVLQYDQLQKGAALGAHTVRITRNVFPVIDPKPELPAKYNVNSAFNIRVVPGENVFDFDLIDPPADAADDPAATPPGEAAGASARPVPEAEAR